MKSEGVGNVVGFNDKNKFLDLKNVICAENLSEYLDDKRINIFDPKSNEVLITGIYQSPYWIIELKVEGINNLDRNIEK